jgi:hypothetical protein
MLIAGHQQQEVIVRIQFKTNEVLILLAATVMSLLANLPEDMLGTLVDRKVLLAGLIALVVVSLFRYLQVYLLLLISILAIGANLPSEMASALGISQTVMLVSLGALITIALLNRAIQLFPSKSEAGPVGDDEDGRLEMMAAIARGDQVTLHRMLVMNASTNFTLEGMTPLHLAAEKGYPEIVRLLISYGADYRKKNSAGMTALEIAQAKKKFVQTTEILNTASGQGEPHRRDAEIWQRQHKN